MTTVHLALALLLAAVALGMAARVGPLLDDRKGCALLRLGASLFLVGALAIAAASFLDVRSPSDVQAYIGMAREGPPPWRDLALRRFGPGDPARSLVARHPAAERLVVGEFEFLFFEPRGSFTNLVVTARRGRLIQAAAHSCTWSHEFFAVQPHAGEADAAWRLERQRRAFDRAVPHLEESLGRADTVIVARELPDERETERPRFRRFVVRQVVLGRRESLDVWCLRADEVDSFPSGRWSPRDVVLVQRQDATWCLYPIEALDRLATAVE